MVILDRNVLNHYLIHPSHAVRSFAMSLLIASSSTTKPYSAMTFELLKQHLRSCHADPDAKFRNEILAHEKNMVKRIKGAISVLQKDIQRLAIKASKAKADGTPVNTHISQGAKHIANAGEIWLRDSLHAHEEFSRWYLAFLQHELVPTASFQRHSTALKSLVNIVKLSKDSSSFSGECIFRDPQWIRILLDLVMDPFDDVRQTAVGLLMLCPVEITRESMAYGNSQPDSTPLTILTEFYDKAASLASRTSRADHSDGTARSLGLLCAWQDTLDARVSLVSKTLDGLEQKIMAAEEDLGHAVMFVPVHGDFAAIRCMWEVLSQLENRYTDEEQQALGRLQQRIATLCARIWNTVSYVLCDDSPEGHLPEELEEIEGLDTKGLLSYSFRAIYESSNLMRTIVANLRFYRAAGFLLPPPQVFEAIGNLAFTQLSTLRHRGAFSSVSLTFTTCCQHARDPPVASPVGEKSLLAIWYEGTLACIQTQRSTTRRSAGIPALMTGILASNADSPSFKEVMRTLQDIAAQPAHVSETDGSNLPQVHAFNCIKEVFKTSLLSKNAEAYLPECLQLATSSLKSGVWAIRNCALLLLRSLIDTLFGTSESKSAMETGWDGKTLRLSYTKYATLPPILLNLLQSGEQAMEPSTLSSQSSAAESVFPALEIIRRAGPPESNRDELFGYITEYLGSRQWHVREIAARTLCSFLLSGDWLAAIKTLLSESRGSANRVHGTLLTIKFFLERKLVEKTDKCSDGESASDTLYTKFPCAKDMQAGIEQLVHALAASEGTFLLCSETAATYAEILNLLSSFDLLQVSTSAQTQLTATTDPSTRDGCYKSIALLTDRLGVMRLRRAAASADLQALELCLVDVLNKDIDTACALLQAVPIVWVDGQMSKLCGLYLRLCKYTTVPEVRAVALTNLAGLLDAFIANNDLQTLPHPDELDDLQHALQDTINPALANAILLASGSIMALHTVPHHHQLSFVTFEQRLRSWGKAISDALNESNTFDMRMAATRALKSFLTALRNAVGDEAAYIPCLLALYTTLVDDDEDIRALGAEAAAFVITEDASVRRPQPLVAVDAADALLAWLQSHFGRTNEFRAYVACRLVGDPLIAVDIGVQDLSAWRAQKEAFDEALEVDESLFAVEEQNLFIDEVRETERWAVVFGALEWDYDEIEEEDGTVSRVLMMDSSLSALKGWTEEGLRCLTQHATKKDGPLGWASTADAFALCHRVLVCSRMMSKVLGSEDQRVIETLQGDIQRMGLQERLHGLLLSAL